MTCCFRVVDLRVSIFIFASQLYKLKKDQVEKRSRTGFLEDTTVAQNLYVHILGLISFISTLSQGLCSSFSCTMYKIYPTHTVSLDQCSHLSSDKVKSTRDPCPSTTQNPSLP